MKGGLDLYVMQMGRTGAIKVGRSSNVKRRRAELQTGCPYEIRILLVAEDQGHKERPLHEWLHPFRLRNEKGEWFSETALGSLPNDIYSMMSEETINMINRDWWKSSPNP